MPPPVFDEKSLIPSLPYYDLPAGLMVPLIKMEDSGYKSLNPKDIRLPPPTPPTERLLAAIDMFYAPPSHERPRDPEGFEMLGLYEWSKDKTAAIKAKADDLEFGRRERSPTASPEPFGSEDDGDDVISRDSAAGRKSPATSANKEADAEKAEETKRKRYRSLSKTPPPRRRSRSRTRSRSRGSTPDRGGSGGGGRSGSRGRRRSGGSYGGGGSSRSPSPPGGYSMPSYLTRRSPSPTSGGSGGNRRGRSPPSTRRRGGRRSSSPETSFAGFGAQQQTSAPATRLDSSNKGHQMLQKMGWSGSGGLGSDESGIAEPISGGEVRDKNSLYRGVGSGGPDAFEAFRKNKAGTFYTRMKDRGGTEKESKPSKK